MNRRALLKSAALVAIPAPVIATQIVEAAEPEMTLEDRAKYHCDQLLAVMKELHPHRKWRSVLAHDAFFSIVIGDA